MSRGWQVVVFVLFLAVPVHSRAQPENQPLTLRERAARVNEAQVQGIVTDSHGRPVAGAEVWDQTYPTDPEYPNWPFWEKKTVTGPAGHFSFQSSQERAYLWICHPDYLPESLSLESLTVPPSSFVLRPAGKVSGRVVDSSGRPIAGARIQTDLPRTKPAPIDCPVGEPVAGPCGENGPIVASDAAGLFTISSVAPGTYELGAYAEGYTPGWSDRLKVKAGKETTGVTIVLEPGTRLAGRVVGSDGKSVPGARISTSGECPPYKDQPVRSAEDGSYSIRCIMPGFQRMEIEHPEHSTVFTDLRLTPGNNTLDWTLRNRVKVQGRIVTPDGAPADAEKAFIWSPQAPQSSLFTLDLREGSRFSGWVDAGAPLEISAQVEGYAAGKAILPASRPGDRIEGVEIRLGRGARLTGRVSGLSPREPKADIEARLVSSHTFASASGKMDDEGRYEIPGLLPGTWEVTARSGQRTLTERVTLGPEGSETALDFTFSPFFEVRGRIVPAPPWKPRNYSLTFYNERSQVVAQASVDGSFTVQLESGAYGVRTSDVLVHTGAPVIVAGAPVEGVEIRLRPGARLQGRIKRHRPVPLYAKSSALGEWHGRTSRTRDSYVLEGLEPGDWQVRAYLEDRTVTGRITITPDESLATLDLDPAFGKLTLSGHLAGEGPVIKGMVVSLLQENPEITYRPVIEEYGIFRFTRLRKGSYRLRVGWNGPTDVLYEQDIEISADREVVIDLSDMDQASRSDASRP